MICARCGTDYEPRLGRGRQSPYCEACRSQRRRAANAVRQLRYANAMVNEWVEALGPLIVAWKEELTDKQDGRCLRCGRRQRLYFARDDNEELIGLCADDHAIWTDERRNPHGDRRPRRGAGHPTA